MLKLCFVIGSLDRGGTEKHLTRVLPDLVKSDVKINIFCITHKGQLADELENKGVRVFAFPLFGYLSIRFMVFKPIFLVWVIIRFLIHIFANRYDAIHFFLPTSYLVLGPFSLLHRRSKKLMSRRSLNLYQLKYPRIIVKFEQWLHKKMDFILGNSQKVINQLAIDEFVSPSKLWLIYNGITLPHLSHETRSNVREKLNIPNESVVMAVVANLIPYKGHEDLLEACGKLKYKNWQLLLIGENTSGIQCQLEKVAREKNIQKNVRFLGSRDNIFEILAASDIGLLVSHEEGFSNAILEGMAVGLPMIVSDVGGNKEAVINSITGIVVPAKNSSEIQHAIETLIDNPKLRKKMGNAGRKRIHEHFSHESCIKQYKDLYKTLFKSDNKAYEDHV